MSMNFKELVNESYILTELPVGRETEFTAVVINMCFGGFGLSDTAIEMIGEKYPDRHDLKLVECVKKLGCKASDDCAELQVVYIPSCYGYEIEEYDGLENVRLLAKREVIRDLAGNPDKLMEYLDAAYLIK